MLKLPADTLIFGHRGASANAPQNTLRAFHLAVEQGAAGIELDVHLTADGQLVVIHDFTVDHTTNGSGAVAEMTLEQIRMLDAGAWFSEAYQNTYVPTLQEVFEMLQGQSWVNVEIKASTQGIEQAVAAAIEQYGMIEKVVISSFDPSIVRRFQSLMPQALTGWLYVEGAGYDPHEILRDLHVSAVHPYHEMIDADYMTWARERGYVVNTWTVNDPQRALLLRDLGVNVIITDHPALLRDVFAANARAAQ